MSFITEIPITDWDQSRPTTVQQEAVRALEQGSVLFFPHLGFPLKDSERQLLSPDLAAAGSKNLSFNVATGKLGKTELDESSAKKIETMLRRFAEFSKALVRSLVPAYADWMTQARTSLRPAEIEGRSTSWRKDDTRLHVDSFPSSPVQGKRILRVFCNINPDGRGRTWRLGEPFEQVASHFLPSLSNPAWGSSQLLHLLGITKSQRTVYDHFMLQIHDRMKSDQAYQSQATQLTWDFPPGSTWIMFVDQVSHAATAGQYALEQTFYVPLSAMKDPSQSPLRILERLTSRHLV
ncbi:MAG TPA: Kdo hydroxylase family protein [Tepidisphaeraceae bacterium]